MKSYGLLLTGFLLLTFHFRILAQEMQAEPERGSVLPGYIITLSGDTINGYLLNINLWMNQHMTFLHKDPNDAKGRIKYKPKEISAYKVGNRYYESMDYTFSYSTHNNNFILRKVEGPISLYVWYYDEDRGNLMSPDISLSELASAYLFDEKDLWKDEFGKKPNGEFTQLNGLKFMMKFAKNMSNYVQDDTELADKISNKTKGYQNIDIEKIIREYNNWKSGKMAND